MDNSDEYMTLRQAGADTPIPKILSPEYREILNTVIAAQKILESVGGSYGLQLWIIPRSEYEEEYPTLDFVVKGFTQVSLSLIPAEGELSGFIWEHESMNMGGYATTKLPVSNSPWSLIFQLIWMTQDLVEGCTEFIGQEVRNCEDFNVISKIRDLVATGLLPAEDEFMLWSARTCKPESEDADEYAVEDTDQNNEETDDECINDGDCSGSCDSCSRVRAQNIDNSGKIFPPDPNDPLCGIRID